MRKKMVLDNTALERDLQRGSIESGLVLIPTTLFFLMALQVLLAGSWQTIERARLHDIVIESSIYESLGGESIGFFDDEITYLPGNSYQSHNGQSLNGQSLNGQSLNGQSLNGQSLNGQSLNGQSLNGVQGKRVSALTVQEIPTSVGTIRAFEMSTPLPILGNFFQSIDQGLFKVKNYAVSFIN